MSTRNMMDVRQKLLTRRSVGSSYQASESDIPLDD